MTQSNFIMKLTVLIVIGTQLTQAAQPEDRSRCLMRIPVYFSDPLTSSPAFTSTIRVENLTYADVGNQLRKTYNLDGVLMRYSSHFNDIYNVESFSYVPYPHPQLSFVAIPRRMFNTTEKTCCNHKPVPIPSQSHT